MRYVYIFTPKMRMIDTPDKGRGVVALQHISRGEILEQATSFVLSKNVKPRGAIAKYMYEYEFKGSTYYVAVLGFGMLYNHSKEHQNVVCGVDRLTGIWTYFAARNIARGEELLIEYNNAEFNEPS